MGIFDLFSKRQKRLCGEVPDIFVYDQIPEALRVQIIHIWRDAFGQDDTYYNHTSNLYKELHDILCREYGTFGLVEERTRSHEQALAKFFLSSEDTEKVLDVVELIFRGIDNVARKDEFIFFSKPKVSADEAIEELNSRFLEHGIGYQFLSGQLIRKDSELIHAEVVKPVLNFLNEPEYRGANEEFLKAYEHYRHRRYKESLNDCLKSFESVMKTICDKRKWSYSQNDTAKKLIEICFANGLIPNFLQTQFSALKSVLESGVPTARNKLSGHGQGANQAAVPDYFVRYVLHLTATTILFLVEAESALP